MIEHTTPTDTARLLKLATTASVLTALLLIVGKAAAWLLTGSISVLASLVDSLMDAAASIINLVAVRVSLQPPDEEHRFGHGKVEPLAALAQAAFIAGSAVFLVLHAVDRLMHPRPVEDVMVGIVVMGFAVTATAALLLIQRHVIRRTRSTIVRADSLHYTTDLLTNLGTIGALALTQFGWPALDPLFGILVAIYICYGAWHIGHDAFHHLIDRELPDEVRARVKQLASAEPLVRGLHDLRTRQSGAMEIIQLHLELDADLTLGEAHAATDRVEHAIREAFPLADVIIHQDPA
ncbi:MAG TPA: cation diffusion facilitator family transporter [Gammaproteobacteria bacterium]|nr:cation diffusion facilitator family transporter [Gammaproteobacteria bacterium]